MALINCPNCNHEISDKAEKCPSCGFQMKKTFKKKCPECGNILESNVEKCPNCGFQLKRNLKELCITNKKYIICIAILAICIIIGIIIRNNTVYNEDKAIRLAVQEVQSHLLDPSSMIIYECRYLPIDEDENYKEEYEYVYIYAGGRNKGGGITDEHYMVSLLDGKVDSFADSNDATKQDVLVTGSSAASNLWFYLYFEPDSWDEIDVDKASKYIK